MGKSLAVSALWISLCAAPYALGSAGVVTVYSTNATGTYKEGDVITIVVQFTDDTLTVTGSPRILLNTTPARYADFAENQAFGLVFNYTVQAGDGSAKLDYAGTAALELNGGSIKDGTNQDADLTLPAVGSAQSLSQSDIKIDAADPQLVFNFNPSNLISSAATNVSWTATDNVTIPKNLVFKLELVENGVAKAVALTDLDSDTTKVISVNETTGACTFIWYPPNRPGMYKFRLQVTDEAGRSATAESAQFTVQSAQAGTTLRDFDMPGTQPLGISAQIESPANCAACHAGSEANTENIVARWEGGMMANASIDPLFLACLKVANADAPESGDLCLRCHTPRGWLNGRSTPTDGSQMHAEDKIGVACSICHRMVDPRQTIGSAVPSFDNQILMDLGANKPAEYGSGMYVLDPNSQVSDLRRGPFADPIDPSKPNEIPTSVAACDNNHGSVQSPFFMDAKTGAVLCATCHDVSNPAFKAVYGAVGADGTKDVTYELNDLDKKADAFGPGDLMPIERTYSEWLHSVFPATGVELAAFPVCRAAGTFVQNATPTWACPDGGDKRVRTCMDCHMRDTITPRKAEDGDVNIRPDQPIHDLTGGNTWVPAQWAAALPVGDPIKGSLADASARADYMLKNAANLTYEIITGSDGLPKLKVKIENLTGHKLPTGYPEGRRMWLYVKVTDKAGQTYKSGYFGDGTNDANDAVDDGGHLHNNPKLRPRAKVYEAELLDSQDRPFHFVLANKIHKDNRIPPLGFVHATFAAFGGKPIDPDMDEWQTPTQRYADGNNYDETIYDLPAGCAENNLNFSGCARSFEAKLYYQTASKEYMTFLAQAYDFAANGAAWAASGSPPVVMNEIPETQIPAFPPAAPQLLNVWSLRTHGALGDFKIPIDLAPGVNGATSECRKDNALAGRENVIMIQFDQAVMSSNVAGDPEITITSNPPASIDPILVEGYGNCTLTISFPPVPDMSCLTIKLHNIKGACNDLVMNDFTLYLRKLLGDTTNTGRVTSADVAQTKSVIASPSIPLDNTNFRMDVNLDGVLNLSDAVLVKSKSLNRVTCP